MLRTIETLTGGTLRGLQIVGGGSQNLYLNRMTATVTGLPVRAGPVEATVTGNAPGPGHRRMDASPSLADARRHVAENLRLPEILPRPTPGLEERARRYAALEARYLGARAS